MKNWVIQGLLYDINPSPLTYIKSRWYHFHFCKKEDPTITASLYLDNLAGEVNHEISKQTSVNKKSLTLSVIKKILENKNITERQLDLRKSDLYSNLSTVFNTLKNITKADEYIDKSIAIAQKYMEIIKGIDELKITYQNNENLPFFE